MLASGLDCTGEAGLAHKLRSRHHAESAIQRSTGRQGLLFKASSRFSNKGRLIQHRSRAYAAPTSPSPVRLVKEFLGSKALGSKRLPLGSFCRRRPPLGVRSCTAQPRRAGLASRGRLVVDMRTVEVPEEDEGNAAPYHGTSHNKEDLLDYSWKQIRVNGQAAAEHSEGPLDEPLHINGHVLHPLQKQHSAHSLSHDQDTSSFHVASNGHAQDLPFSASSYALSLPPDKSNQKEPRGQEQNLKEAVRRLEEELERIKVGR